MTTSQEHEGGQSAISSRELEHDRKSPTQLATHMGMGFVCHDRRERERAIEAFSFVDQFQFQHLDEATAHEASVAYVDALWKKDEIEDACRVNGEIEQDAVDAADWTPVEEAFGRRASLAGIDPAYAELSTVGWRRHKAGGDYWTPLMKAQMHELQAALGEPDYPRKERNGQSGFGPEAARYVLGVELHDMRAFEEMVEAMTPYFKKIANRHQNGGDKEWSV